MLDASAFTKASAVVEALVRQAILDFWFSIFVFGFYLAEKCI